MPGRCGSESKQANSRECFVLVKEIAAPQRVGKDFPRRRADATLVPMSKHGDSTSSDKIRGLGLLSGGLDSRLAALVLRDQGIDVHAVVFDNPFFEVAGAIAAAKQLDLTLHIIDYTSDMIALLDSPKHGFGSGMNPCIDCHALMLRRAGEFADREGFHFLFTGEVLNQRPMSQNRRSLGIVARESGYEDRIVRPLSAKCLPETEPEMKGWVDRSRLLGLQGRSRKPQLEMARAYGLTDFPSPAGGCRLTDPGFSLRLRELKENGGLDRVRSVVLLRFGRHFRLAQGIKAIVGRNEDENLRIEAMADSHDLVLCLADVTGPTALLPAEAGAEHVRLAAAICARYGDCPREQPARVRIGSRADSQVIEVTPAPDDVITRHMIL